MAGNTDMTLYGLERLIAPSGRALVLGSMPGE